MEINDVIQKVKPKIEKNKLAAKKKEENEARKEQEKKAEQHKQDVLKLKLVEKKWFSKRKDLLKDIDLMNGIKFLESEDKHFELCSGNKWAAYFCSDGEFKIHRWGWYMGAKYIMPITLENAYIIEQKDIEKVAKMDFREELKKQILQLGAKK